MKKNNSSNEGSNIIMYLIKQHVKIFKLVTKMKRLNSVDVLNGRLFTKKVN